MAYKHKNMFSPEQRKWIDALKSGKYKKVKGALLSLTKKNQPKGFCCLGVYCFISDVKWYAKETYGGDWKGYFGKGQDASLTIAQMGKLNLRSDLGEFHDDRVVRGKSIDSLANLNDNTNMTLGEIGKWIEKHPKEVFKNWTR